MLSMAEVINHCGNLNWPSFFEGSEILKKGSVIQCKIKKKGADFMDIFAKCLQNSDRTIPSYRVTIKLREKRPAKGANVEKSYVIEKSECTCKPGSKKCPHICAALLKLERTDEEDLENYSPPELLPPSGKEAPPEKGKKINNPLPVKEFACRVAVPEIVDVSCNLRELTPQEIKEACDFLLSGIRD